jgi:hypothetical protein
MYHVEAVWAQNAVGIGMRWEFEDLLHDYDVDLYLSGHYHSYLRTFTCDGLFRDQCGTGGPTHITVGAAGASLDVAELYRYLNSWDELDRQVHQGTVRVREGYRHECECVAF